MGSRKAILILGLMAMVLLISIFSDVVARDLAEASSNPKEAVKEKNEVAGAKYGGYPPGYGGGYPPGGGGNLPPSYPPGNPPIVPPPNAYCSYGCCDWYGSTCVRCCSYAGEAVAVETQDETRN